MGREKKAAAQYQQGMNRGITPYALTKAFETHFSGGSGHGHGSGGIQVHSVHGASPETQGNNQVCAGGERWQPAVRVRYVRQDVCRTWPTIVRWCTKTVHFYFTRI